MNLKTLPKLHLHLHLGGARGRNDRETERTLSTHAQLRFSMSRADKVDAGVKGMRVFAGQPNIPERSEVTGGDLRIGGGNSGLFCRL
jgi:hypothetical protein